MSFLEDLNDSLLENYFLSNSDLFFSFLQSNCSDLDVKLHISYINAGENQYTIAYKLNLEYNRVVSFTSGFLYGDKYDKILIDYFNIDFDYYKKESLKNYEKAKSKYDYYVNLFLSKGVDSSVIPEFKLTDSDFEFFKVKKYNKNRDYNNDGCLSDNSHFIFKHSERLNDEFASYYEIGNYTYSENESYFWLHLRYILDINFDDIEKLSNGKFLRSELCKLEYPYKNKKDEINLDREAYFNFLKILLVEKNSDVFSDMFIEVFEYKFYISNFYVTYSKDSLYNNNFVFLPYNINKEKKCMKTRLNFILR